jgi:hypothetical protein
MTKWDLSELISEAERKNPAAKRKRGEAVAKGRERRFGKELVDLEDKWQRFSDGDGHILAVYKRGKTKTVDLLRVNEAYINSRGKLKLGVARPKLHRSQS